MSDFSGRVLTPGDTVRVPVTSAWASKINWTQGVTGAAVILAYFGINLDPATQAAILAVIAGANVVGTWVLRTWFTTSVTPAAIAK